MAELYGDDRVRRFVKDGLERFRNRDTPPIVLLIGPHGSGKTALIEKLEADHRKAAPVARLDFSASSDAGSASVLLSVMSELSKHVDRIGSPRFPRLKIGLIAVTLDSESPEGLKEELDRKLRNRHPVTGEMLSRVAVVASLLLPTPVDGKVKDLGQVIGWAVDGIRKHQLGSYLGWYAANVGHEHGFGDRLGPLLHLHGQSRWHESSEESGRGGAGNARRDADSLVWRVLCRALLADLRDGFNKATLTHGRRTANCLLLLDNADTAISQEFIQTLAECREESPRETDPLLVVAAKGTLPDSRPSVGDPIAASAGNLTYKKWLEKSRPQGENRSQWYPIRLSKFTESHVETMTNSHVLGRKWQDANFVYGLTGGHPACTEILVRKLTDMSQSSDVREVLTREVEDDLLRTLRPGGEPTDRQLDAMAVLSLAHKPSFGAGISVFRHLGEDGSLYPEIRDLFTSLMWGKEEKGLEIDPLPLLLLSSRAARKKDRWEAVHDGFLAYYRSERGRDEVSGKYHILAQVTMSSFSDIQKVVDFLDCLFENGNLEEWHKNLKIISLAPNRIRFSGLDRGGSGGESNFAGSPEDAVRFLAGARKQGDRKRVISRLLIALWLHNDWLFDPERRLARLLEQEYFELAEMTAGSGELFFREAGKYRNTAREWGIGL